MKLYLSGPMSGMPDLNRPAAVLAKIRLQAAGFQVVSPWDFVQNAGLEGDLVTPEVRARFLRKDLHELSPCDGVALLDGWRQSVGANIEVFVAGLLDLPALPVAYWEGHGPLCDYSWARQSADLRVVLGHLEGLALR